MTVSAPDDHTVQFVLPTPFAPFLRSMGTAIYPRHVLEPRVDDGTFAETWSIDADPAEVIGTGPFTIERYDPGDARGLPAQPELLAAGRRRATGCRTWTRLFRPSFPTSRLSWPRSDQGRRTCTAC